MTALVERDAELARIEQALASAGAGRGSTLVIEGLAGIGKSELMAAAGARGQAAGMRVLRARGAQLERDFAFGVARQLFEPALMQAGPQERAALLDGAAGIAGRLLGLPGAGRPTAAGAADATFAVLHGLYWLCANLAAERPLCLLVDDAHWSDTPSLRYLAFLHRRLDELGVALLLAARPGEAGAGLELLGEIADDPSTALVRPGPLSVAGVAGLLAPALGTLPEASFVSACHHATGGNPFLVGQLGRGLVEDRVDPSGAAAARIESLGARWAGRWILARLARLPASAVKLARALAVLERADLATAAALAGLDPAGAADGADALVAAGILAPGRPLAFAHAIVRAGIYAEIGSAERGRAHRRAAGLLHDADPSQQAVAEHLLASEPAGDAWVVETLVAAARGAARSGAAEPAAVYLRRALAEPPPAEQRPGLTLELGVAEDNAGLPGSRMRMKQAIALAPDGRERAAAALVLGHALARDNRFADAVEMLDRAAGWTGDGDRRLHRALESLAASVATFSVATADGHAARIRAARARPDVEPDPSQEELALAAQIAVRTNEPAGVAAALALRALDVGRDVVTEPADLPWIHQCSVTLLWSERYAVLRELLDRAVAGARANGDAGLFTGALAYRGWLALRRGDLREAEADARTALDAADLPAPPMYRLRNVAVLIEALVEQGDLHAAQRALEPVYVEAGRDSIIAANLRVARGRLRLAQRRPEEALEDFLGAGATAVATRFVAPSCLAWRSQAALARLALGDAGGAATLAGEELELARAFGAPRALGVALTVAGLAAAADGEPLLREAVAALAGADARLELARAQTALGAFLRRANRRADARGPLSEALELAHRAGARPLAAEAETELRATGARPRRLVLSGLEALTASERRVAELAAEGLTNREIAQALFVTARTVEGHLTRVFAKLDVSSRDELPGRLAGAGQPGYAPAVGAG